VKVPLAAVVGKATFKYPFVVIDSSGGMGGYGLLESIVMGGCGWIVSARGITNGPKTLRLPIWAISPLLAMVMGSPVVWLKDVPLKTKVLVWVVLVSFNSTVRVSPELILDGHWGSTLIPPEANATPAPVAIKATANMDAILTLFFVFLDTDIFVSSFLFSSQKIENLAINLFFYCQSFLGQNSENCRFSAGLPDKKYHKYKNCSIYGAMALV
jgi:hypothetical protein